MGTLVNQGARGNISYKEGMAVFNGINSKGTKVKIDITGGYEDGKDVPLDVEKFKASFRDLITQSAMKALERETNKSNQEKIKKELEERIKAFEKGKEISINIDEAMGVYIPDNNVLVMSAVGNPVTTKKGRLYHNIKPIEDEKNNKSYVPIQTTARAMVMTRESFSKLSDEDKKTIKYDKNSANAGDWKWKKLSISDIERGNIDLLTVQLEATLTKAFSKPNDLISILSKDEEYLNFMMKEKDKELRGSHLIVKSSEKDKIVVPRTSIYVPEHRILEQAGCDNIKELMKKIFEMANRNAPEDRKFYIPFESENKSLKIDETNIDTIKSNRILKDTFKSILKQFDYSYSEMLKFTGVKDGESDINEYIKITDALHVAKDRKEYVDATKKLYKMIERDGLVNSPVVISFPLKTSDYELRDNPFYQKKQKEVISGLLTKMSKDMTAPLEKVFARHLLSENKSDYMTKIRNRVDARIGIDTEAKALSYKTDANGFTLKDKMFIELNGRIFNQDGFTNNDGKKIPSMGFTAVRVSTKNAEEKEAFIGVSGVGGRKFEYPKSTAILAGMGMAYIAQPLKNLKVDNDNVPTLQRNPLTGEEASVKIVEKVETPVVEETSVPEAKNTTSSVVDEKASLKDNKTEIEAPIIEEDKEVETKVVSLFDNAEDEVPTVEDVEMTVATPEDIRAEMSISLGDGIDLDDLAGFLDDDEEIDVKQGNEVNSRQVDGVSDITP